MFCAKCGKELPEEVRFCPVCGVIVDKSVSSARKVLVACDAVAGPSAGATEMKRARQLAGVMDVALIVLMFLPWVNIDFGLWAGSFSLLDFASAGDEVRTMLSYLGSSSQDVTSAQQGLGIFSVAIVILWLVVVVLLARNAYGNFGGKKPFGIGGAWGACSSSAAALVICLLVYGAVSQSGYGMLSGVMTASPWLWITLVLSITLLVYAGYQCARFELKR